MKKGYILTPNNETVAATTALTTAEIHQWFTDHGIDLKEVKLDDDKVSYTYTYPSDEVDAMDYHAKSVKIKDNSYIEVKQLDDNGEWRS